ncbi:MAG: hypothetical protein CML03_00960 [Pseudooceanicola sp.]|nr:hypothetical protein [Pseudooceanicola sp.]|tara:strand:+ start:20966 stop:21439 length:474 start_codon:yes stop_codon:yes gene_type:complete
MADFTVITGYPLQRELSVHILNGTESTCNNWDNVLMVQSESDRKAFADRLVKAAAFAGYKGRGVGADLAELFDVTPKAVSKWVNAETMPRRGKIDEMAKTFKVDRQWLEYGVGTMEDGVSDIKGLAGIVEMGLSPESLRELEDHARLLKLKENSQGQ